jgi:hypothetical protein
MITETRVTIILAICVVLSFVVAHYLNKDYKLNGGKRILSHFRYGRIAYWASLFLLILLENVLRAVGEVLINEYPQLSWLDGWPLVLISVLIGFIFVGSVYLTTYAGYKIRKRLCR